VNNELRLKPSEFASRWNCYSGGLYLGMLHHWDEGDLWQVSQAWIHGRAVEPENEPLFSDRWVAAARLYRMVVRGNLGDQR
jgi:hypothetical protein